MKTFCFTVDDNIRFLKELTENNSQDLFEHPYLAMYKRLHEELGLKVQLNLFYEMPYFTLSQVPVRWREQWRANADWLKLSFHSRLENERPYEFSPYGEVLDDCRAVHQEILRFAGEASLASTTTVHYCVATEDGVRALKDQTVKGLLGLYGTAEAPRASYNLNAEEGARARRGELVHKDGITHAAINMVINLFNKEDALEKIVPYLGRDAVFVMIHEQYFYADYPAYQPDFEEKIKALFVLLGENGFQSAFFEDILMN